MSELMMSAGAKIALLLSLVTVCATVCAATTHRKRDLIRIWLALFFFCTLGSAQQTLNMLSPGEGDLVVDKTTATWSSPEAVVSDLRSDDEERRLRGMDLMGIRDERSRHVSKSDQQVMNVDQVLLRYASLGEDETEQAVVATDIGGDMVYAAVATRRHTGWQRIGAYSCWCKYDTLEDELSTFVGLQAITPSQYELVLHASGGGTGIYDQSETRFRARAGHLVQVASFWSRSQSCPTGAPGPPKCTLDRRWFTPASVDGKAGGILVQSKRTYRAGNELDGEFYVRDLEIQRLQVVRCTSFVWNEAAFRYEKEKTAPKPCAR